MDAVLLRSLPYGNAERLFYLYTPSNKYLRLGVPAKFFNPSYADFADLKRQSKSFAAMTMFNTTAFNFSEGDHLEKLGAATVDADFFTTLESQPEVGRVFDAGDEKPGNEHVVVISHAVWESVFGGKSGAVGQMVRLDGKDYKIVGVMPAGFEYPRKSDLPSEFSVPERTQLWVPSALTPEQLTCRETMEGGCSGFGVGRLKPGVTAKQAQTELSTMMARFDTLHNPVPVTNDFTAALGSLRESALGPVRPLMLLLLGAVGLVLLIACANAANLMLARAADRMQELGVRATLGAKRTRLLRQMLTESSLLAIAAGCAGVSLAWAFLRLLLRLNPGDIPRLEDAGLDYRVLGFLVAATVVTSLLFGVLPSMMATRIDLVQFLKSGGIRGLGGERGWARKALAIAQIALVVSLLIGSGLLLKSYSNVLAVQTGVAPSTVTANIQFSPSMAAVSATPKYGTAEKRRVFFKDLVAGVRNSPGVEAAGLVNLVPLGRADSMGSFVAQGHPDIYKDQLVEVRSVTPEYFSAMGIAQLLGRDFTDEDGPGEPQVVIVNEALAKKYFGSTDVVGQHIGSSAKGPWSTIMGVVGDVRNGGPEADVIPQVYECLWQSDSERWPSTGSYLAVRSVLPEDVVVMDMRAVMKRLDPNLAIADIRTMKEMESMATARRRFQTVLLSVFSGIAMLVALVGVYGLLAFMVRQRAGEIGIRMALGATRMRVARLVLREGMVLLGAGLAIGLGVALATARLLKSFLFGVPAIDPVTYALVPLLLLVGTVAASLFRA